MLVPQSKRLRIVPAVLFTGQMPLRLSSKLHQNMKDNMQRMQINKNNADYAKQILNNISTKVVSN